MKNAEEYRFCLDCWYVENPDTENRNPDKQVGSDNSEELRLQAERLWKARQRNGFKCLILYDGTDSEWEEVESWP